MTNNGGHETVGGMPTVTNNIDLILIANTCRYPYAVIVNSFSSLDCELREARNRNKLSSIVVSFVIGAHEDLGRPNTTALEVKDSFMDYL